MLPEFLIDENTIFHYTKASTAIKYILPDKTLRFSPRKNSKDPIENKKIFITQSVYISDSNIEERTDKDSQAICDLIKNRIETNNQISFCLNKISENHPEYGYKKSRMWNQYGDDFKGVCLAFNRQELLKKPMITFSGKINYITYDEFKNVDFNIDNNDLDKYGRKYYEKDRIKLSNKLLLTKHVDYRDECEFRICNFGQPQFLPFDKSLLGIFVCADIISTNNFNKLMKFTDKLNIPFLDVNFSVLGCREEAELNGNYVKIIRSYIPDK